MTPTKICFTCKHWKVVNYCELKSKKRYWNSRCQKWEDNKTPDIVKDILEYLDKNPPKYEYYKDHQLDSIRLLECRALNCTDGFLTDDEVEYRRKLINKFKSKKRDVD